MMNIALLALISLSLLLAFSTTPSASLLVHDVDGAALRNNEFYYILPAYKGKGGGLGLAQTGDETCPVSVVQEPNELSHGLQVRIDGPNLVPLITEGLPLSLWFDDDGAAPVLDCAAPKWTVVGGLPKAGTWSVKLDGYYYDKTLEGSFRIENFGGEGEDEHYKLVFCTRDSCGDIGIYVDDKGIRQVGVIEINDPFVVVFKKAFNPHLQSVIM